MIEAFSGDWEKEWFTYSREGWALTTLKLNSEIWKAPRDARLSLEVKAAAPNTLVVLLDDHAAEVSLTGGESWQIVILTPGDFQDQDGEALADWSGVRRFKLSPAERLESGRRSSRESRIVGGSWKGEPPRFRNLRWLTADNDSLTK